MSKLAVLITAAGRSSRFPGTRPKWMLTQPNGNMMVCESVRGLKWEGPLFLAYSPDNAPPDFSEEMIKNEFRAANIYLDALVEIKNSPNQPSTAIRALNTLGWTGAFMIKDSDNYWEAELPSPDQSAPCHGFVAMADLHKQAALVAGNKSYARLNPNGYLEEVAERKIISSDFCVGGYGFTSLEVFESAYNKLHDNSEVQALKEIHVSHIIQHMISTGHVFFDVPVHNYADWGTFEDWQRYRAEYKTLFVDIDGVLFKNAARSFSPRWGEAPAIEENCQYLKGLVAAGKTEIILCTSRPESEREKTVAQLASQGIVYRHLIMGLQHSRRYVINDYSRTNPFPAAIAVNLPRDSGQLSGLF